MSTDVRYRPAPVAWERAAVDFAAYLSASGCSRATVATRVAHVRTAGRALGPDPWRVTSDRLLAWAGACTWARDTRRGVYASLRRFYGWGVESGRCAHAPTDRLPRVGAAPAIARPAPEVAYREARAMATPRVQLILDFAARCGMRRAEIAQIHSRDLMEDLAGWSLIVHGKGGRRRIIPIPNDLARAVRQAGGWLLPSERGGGHLTPEHVGKLAARALPGGWTLHTLRHRFATRAHGATRDLLAVQQLLGHASVATTQRYIATERDVLRITLEAASQA